MGYVLMRKRCLILFACVVVSAFLEVQHARGGESIVVEGEADLLQAIQEAYSPSSRRFSRGRMVAHVRELNKGDAVLHDGDVEIVWDGFNARYHSTIQTTDLKKNISRIRRKEETAIETPRGTLIHMPAVPRLTVLPPGRQQITSELQLRPDRRLSHAKFELKGRLWHEYLDPQFLSNQGYVAKVTCERTGPSTIRMTRHFKDPAEIQQNGKVVGVVRGMPDAVVDASLDLGGVITGFSTEPYPTPSGGTFRGTRGEVKWRSDKEGRPCPVSYRCAHFQESESDPEWEIRVTVSEYDHNPVIAKDAFERSSLKLSDGTLIEEFGATGKPLRTSYVGKPPSKELKDGLLDALGNEVKKGFSGPRPR